MKHFIAVLIAVISLVCGNRAFAASGVNVVAATGGSSISADTTGGTYTTLTGPSFTENNPGGVATGTIILNAPAGFVFNAAASVTVNLTHSGQGTDLTLSSTTATVTTSNITINVTSKTTGSRLATIAFVNVQVRPSAGTPLATGTITKSGTSSFSETGSVGNYGTLTETVGALRYLFVTLPGQTFTAGSGNSGTVTAQTAGTAFNITKLTATDQFTNIVTTYTGAKTISYSGPSGSPTYTTSVTFSSGASTTTLATTLKVAETTTITATATSITGVPSSPLTVNTGAANKLQILLPGETAAPGTTTGKTGSPTAISAFTSINATVNYVDANWNTINSSDVVHFTSTDSSAVLPPNTALSAGTGTFSMTLKTRTNTTVTVSDVTSGGITANTSASISVTNNPPVLNSVSNLTGAFEDTNFTISYATLRAQADLTDIDISPADTLYFRVQAISTGTLTQSGTNAVAGVTLLTPTSAALVWRGAANANGTLNAFTVRASDGSAFSTTTAQVSVDVTAVNDVPSFTKGANQTVLEDSGIRTVTSWATAMSTGPSDESAQALSFIVSNNNTNLFSTQPTISSAGTLTFTPAANANGSATVTVSIQDDGGTANSGVDTSASQTFTITVTAVNDTPSFVKGSDISVFEDSGANTFSSWATSISAGATDETAQTLSFQVSNNNTNLFSTQPTISTNGTLSFTPAANAVGSATVTVSLRDNGGTANGGSDTSGSQTFTITVNGVNDAPSFTKGANQTVLEDSGTRTVTSWATALSTGPSDESAQNLSFIVSNNNTSLFSTQPAISSAGTLTFTPAANANGSATVTVSIQDDGGTANSGVDTSASQTFTITVTAVNDTPSFAKGSDISVLEDSGVNTFSGWATSISAGPSDESAQTLSFQVSNNNTNLFSTQPAISANGTLTFTPAVSAIGSATVTVSLRDSGGTANSGSDTSGSQTFTITVSGINDAPSFTKGANQTVLEDSTARTVSGWATSISAGPSDESGQTVSFVVSNDNNGLFSVQPSVASNGTLTFTPAANANGTATVSIYAQDNGGIANGGNDTSATQTFTITVTAINDIPSFTKGSDVSVVESSGPQSFGTWATSISAGPANESSQTLTFVVSNNNSNLFSAQPSISTNGTLTFTPASSQNGSATVSVYLRDNGGTANSGVDTTASQTFTITVTDLNDAPTLDVISDVTVLEDASQRTINLTGISAGPNETSQTITNFTASTSNTNLIANLSVQYSIGDSTATLRFTPVANANGSATITVTLQDDGGTAGTGVDQLSRTFNVTVTSVNDVPAFTKGTNVVVRTTTSPQSLSSWATGISAGPSDEGNQTLAFHVSNNNNAMFSVQPSVSTNGTLTFTPAANGTATVSIYLQDNGGTANSGSDTTATQTFTIIVYPVNISPSFSMSTNLTVLEDSTAQTITNWATSISAGSADESGQTLTFIVTNNNNSLFSSQPTLSTSGVLTFAPAPDAYGTAEVTVVLQDDGDTANYGANLSAAQTFTLNITGINDAPSFTKGLDIALGLNASRIQTFGAWATDITAGSNELSQTLTFVVTNDTPEAFSQQPAIAADGTLTFTIAPTATNVLANVSVQLVDNGGTSNGGIDSTAVQTFRITLSRTYGSPGSIPTGQGPTGLYLGNLRGLTFAGATKSGGPRYRDMIIANYLDNTVSVRFCNDDGTFTDATTYAVGLNPFGVISADLNSDGFEEIIAGNSGTNTISVLVNNGDRTFASAAHYTVGSSSNPEPIAVMRDDFNGDGRFDVVVANHNDNSVSVLLGNGNGTLKNATNFAVGAGPMCVWTGDFNGDKKTDIVTANKAANTLTILPGLGNGSFGTAQTVTLFAGGNPQPTYVLAGDLNSDFKMDLVVANYGSNTVSVLLGNGNGTFQISSNYAVGTNPRSVLIRDLDRDGKLDIAVANSGSASVTILQNRGDGTFDTAGSFSVGSSPVIVWGSNFDGDDATDLAISNYGDNSISILRYGGPLAYSSQISLLEDHAVPVTLRGQILNSGSLAYAILSNPSHGTLSGTAPNLVYTPATNFNGTDTIRYQVTYTAGDLILDSTAAIITLKVSPVNDAPSFAFSTSTLTITNFYTAQTNVNFATSISSGPSDESAQQLTFTVATTNSTLFDMQPKISSNGTLTFRPAVNKYGTATVSVRLADNGGSLNGGTNGSAVQTFCIVVLPNPLTTLKGVYSGLFYESTGVQANSSGYFNLTLTDRRTFTGKLMHTGKTYTLNGTFATNGVAQVTIPRLSLSSLNVTLNLNLSGAANDQMSGRVTDGIWSSDLFGNRSVFAITNPAPYAGKYTMAFGGNPGNVNKPAGDGLGMVTVKPDGTVTLAGVLADATAVSQSTPVARDGSWPLYASLYGGNGVVIGWMTFTNTADSNLEGDVSWIKTGIVGGKYYPRGFTNDIVAVGSTFSTPAVGTRILTLTNAFVELSDGNLSRSLTNRVTLNTNNVVSAALPNTNSLVVTITSSSGAVTGGFVNPQTKARMSMRGVVLQKQNGIYGFFQGTNQSGLFLLHP